MICLARHKGYVGLWGHAQTTSEEGKIGAVRLRVLLKEIACIMGKGSGKCDESRICVRQDSMLEIEEFKQRIDNILFQSCFPKKTYKGPKRKIRDLESRNRCSNTQVLKALKIGGKEDVGG